MKDILIATAAAINIAVIILVFIEIVETTRIETITAAEHKGRKTIIKPKKDVPNPVNMVKKEPEVILKTLKVVQKESKKEPEWTDTYEITAYTAGPESTGKNPGHPAYGITKSGERVTEGLTIACPPEIELYTKVEIEGIGTRECHDRGGAIKGKIIDLYIPELAKALEFGRQERRIRILE